MNRWKLSVYLGTLVLLSCRTTSGVQELKSSESKAAGATPSQGQTFPQVINYLVVEVVDGDLYKLNAKSPLDAWCEDRCSTFELIEEQGDKSVDLVAYKTRQPGNTTPSALDVSRNVKIPNKSVQKITVKHVGRKNNSIVLQDVLNRQSLNFYALDAQILRNQKSGKYQIVVGSESLNVVPANDGVAQQLNAATKGEFQGFVTGSIQETSERSFRLESLALD